MIRRLIRALVAVIGIALIGGSAGLLFAPRAVEPTLPVDAIARSQLLSEPVVRAGTFAALGVGFVYTAINLPDRGFAILAAAAILVAIGVTGTLFAREPGQEPTY